jgi:hypothetical protein
MAATPDRQLKAEWQQHQIGNFAVNLVAYTDHQGRQENQHKRGARVRITVGKR